MALGLYIHTPFCAGKCPYCDFYSIAGTDELFDAYTAAVAVQLDNFGGEVVDTVYFGGGTPSLLGAKRLSFLLERIYQCFDIAENAEITLEMNPGDASTELLATLRTAGFNRLSMGVQSGLDEELRLLGRRHTAAQAREAVELSRKAGFENISLDLMLGIPNQTPETLAQSVDFLCSLEPEHISAYILKIEPDTPFAKMRNTLCLADDDAQAEYYLQTVRQLFTHGYEQYEISNFCISGHESRHNIKYWHCEEYIGIGPSAHSFYNGRRYYYPRSIEQFIHSPQTIDDGEGGSPEEYIMLALRLREGLTRTGYRERFSEDIPSNIFERARKFEQAGFLISDSGGIHLTAQGFLISNAIIAALLEE